MSTHGRDHFFKYATKNTALKVIESRSFRWSAPTKFNDPFDHQHGFALPTSAELLDQIRTTTLEIIYGDGEITGENEFAALIRSLRAAARQIDREEFIELVEGKNIFNDMVAELRNQAPVLNKDTIAALCHSRVFCITEECDNQVMWSHYADEHRGVVFKLRCGEAVDTVLNAARIVDYTNQFVPLPHFSAILGKEAGFADVDVHELVWKLVCCKHRDWAYEKEWRLHLNLPNEHPAGDGFTDYSETLEVFDSIYLGCRMLPDDIKLVGEAVERHLPNMKIFLSKLRTDSFGLTFEPLNGL